MPDTIANPYHYSSPIAGSLSQLTRAFLSGPSEEQKILRAEEALKLQRAREGDETAAGVFNRYGTPGFDRNAAVAASIRGGADPDRLAHAERYLAGNTYGATDPRTTNAYVGAGGAYSSTSAGFREGESTRRDIAANQLAENQRQFNETPQVIGTPTGPVIAKRAESYGQPAVEDLGKVKGDYARRMINQPTGLENLTPTQSHFIGADRASTTTPHNYRLGDKNYITYDGKTDAQTGQPLPPGGYMAPQGDVTTGLRPNVVGKIQESDIATQKARGVIDYVKGQISPQNVGGVGWIKGGAQDVAQLAGNMAAGLGYNGLQDAVADLQRKAVANGVKPDAVAGLFTFDSSLPKLQTAHSMLVYSLAEALAGQSGRAVSDRDVRAATHAFGNPGEFFASPDSIRARLQAAEDLLDIHQEVNRRYTNAPAAGAPPVAAPAAPGAGNPTPRPAPASPPVEGAQQAPDGNWYVPDPNRPGGFLKVVQ